VVDQQERFVRRPRVGLAEEVADQLRRRLLSGELKEGDMLPKQENLMEAYGVSKVALREALRILETEGLVEVRRGNVGGAVVHIPQPDAAAYTLGLVLQARQVSFVEVRTALLHLEPVCAGLCAGRSDRKKKVVPGLRASQRALRKAIAADNSTETVSAIRGFHEAIVNSCGNETLIVVVGTLEAIWTTHAQVSGASATAAGNLHDPARRAATADVHEEILDHIDHGDVDLATKAARAHLESAGLHSVPISADFPVEAAAIRERAFRGGPSRSWNPG
jgi:GntR family transcriptional regulator, transcriptional repressor for pyruvate dehydrogenase complex